MKVFCVYLSDYRDRNDYYLSLMPVGIVSIASYLENSGHDVTLANFSFYGYLKAVEETIKSSPDAVAVSIFSFNRTESLKYIRELKKRDKKIIIIAGGQHPTFLSELIFTDYPEIDFIVKGEGELSIKKILDNTFVLTDRIITTERIKDIDTLPWASSFSGRTIGVNSNEQFKYIITSRGCPSNCTYCSSPSFWENKVTFRSAKDIINELLHIRKKFGIIYFSIRDDNFTLNKKRVLEFCDLLSKSGLFMMWNCQARVDTIDEEMLIAMKSCGLEHIQFGVESGSEKILKVYDKRININKIKEAAYLTRKVGTYLSFYLMTGMDGETPSDINDTKNLISETMPHDVVVSPVAYYPGTKIYKDAKARERINDSIWFKTDNNGIYLNDLNKTSKLIKNILKHASEVSLKAAYNKNDFTIHKKTTGNDCWMNYIIEGDHYADLPDLKKASDTYNNLISKFPQNIWGYLRHAGLIAENKPEVAVRLLTEAAGIVPNYYGTWYMMARILYINGNINKAEKAIIKALRYNQYDNELIELAALIRKK